ncbi:hypothetical protein VTN77DRAFT_7774 [Rasamsonia byssochlamydoides]|uniref:uncharacterized protein n=1 Tax=Rasamsonia byssochlamydoides TaxID=89139 RepID=UPI00374284FA
MYSSLWSFYGPDNHFLQPRTDEKWHRCLPPALVVVLAVPVPLALHPAAFILAPFEIARLLTIAAVAGLRDQNLIHPDNRTPWNLATSMPLLLPPTMTWLPSWRSSL